MTRIAVTLLLALLATGASAAESGLQLVVILDNSGSMNELMRGGDSRIQVAKRSLLKVLGQLPPDARVGVVPLNPPRRGQDWLVPLGPVDPQANAAAVGAVRAQGPTPLGAALRTAADELLAARAKARYGDYKVLIVSDGEATDPQLVERLLPEAQARGLLFDVIGVEMRQDHSLAARANTYRNAEDPASLEQAISAVVLGESTGVQDAGRDDFDVLQPIPAEVAGAALQALTAPENRPLGESGAVRVAADQGPTAPAPQPGPPGRDGRSGGALAQVVVIGVVVLIVIVRLLAKAGGRH